LYQQFFNFNTAPFSIAPDPHFIYMSERHQEGLAHLLYGISQGGGFVALTGEVGTGKTTLCHCLLHELPAHIDIALIFNPKLNTLELLATICDELHIPYDRDKQSLKNLIDCLNQHLLTAHAEGRRTVLMIDEAQNLSLDVLEQIRLLTNLETSTTKLLQIILIGQPELKQLLERRQLRQLNQRITAKYHLTSLSFSDTQEYIKHRLSVCGGDSNIFNRGSIRKIYKLSQGIPRLINILCDRALLGAYVTNSQFVTKKIINKAAKEVLTPVATSTILSLSSASLGVILIAALGISVYYLVPDKSPEKHIILSGSFNVPVAESTHLKQVDLKPEKLKTQLLNLDFNSLLRQKNTSINTAIHELAKLWRKETTPDTNCKKVEAKGLQCVLGKSNWEDLLAFNRPVIMEFSISDTEKHYAILLGSKEGDPVFSVNADISFPIEKILALWDGFYMMLWQPPIQNIKAIYPGQSSEAVLWIRKHLPLNSNHSLRGLSSTFFDAQLKSEVIKFQQLHQLIPDGIVGPQTFIHLSNNDLSNKSPKLNLDY
jgi:general secretion pathway protein A